MISNLRRVIALILLGITIALPFGEGESYAPTSIRAMAGTSRNFVALGDSSTLVYGPDLEWCRVETPFSGYPAEPVGIVSVNENLLAIAGKRSLSFVSDESAWYLGSFERMNLGEILGITSCDERICFFTQDGWGFVNTETFEVKYHGGFQAVTGFFLKKVVINKDGVYCLTQNGKILHYIDASFSTIESASRITDIIGAENCILATDGEEIICWKEGISAFKKKFANVRSGNYKGNGVFLVHKGFFTATGELVELSADNPSAIADYKQLIASKADGEIYDAQGNKLPHATEKYMDPVAFFDMHGDGYFLFSNGYVDGTEASLKFSSLSDCRKIYPLQHGGMFIKGNELSVPVDDDEVHTAKISFEPYSAFYIRDRKTSVNRILCAQTDGKKFYSIVEGEVGEISEGDFIDQLLAHKLVELPGGKRVSVHASLRALGRELWSIRDIFKAPNLLGYPNGGVAVLFSDELVFLDFESNRTLRFSSPNGEKFSGMDCIEGFLYVYSSTTLYFLENRQLVEAYCPGDAIRILGLRNNEDTISILLSCATAVTVPGLCVRTQNREDKYEVGIRYIERYSGMDEKLRVVSSQMEDKPVKLTQKNSAFEDEVVIDKKPMRGDLNPVSMVALKGDHIYLPLVRYMSSEQRLDDTATRLFEAARKSLDKTPLFPSIPALNIAGNLSEFSATGGNFVFTSELTSSLRFRKIRAKLLPLHSASTETFFGLKMARYAHPFSNGMLALSEAYELFVNAEGMRTFELTIEYPQTCDLMFTRKTKEECSICYYTEELGAIPLPTHFLSEENSFTCVVPPSLWEGNNSAIFYLATDASGKPGSFWVPASSETFFFSGETIGELSIPVSSGARISLYKGDTFLFGALSESLAGELSWWKNGYKAREFYGTPYLSASKEPIRLIGVAWEKDHYRKFVYDFMLPWEELSELTVYPNVDKVCAGETMSLFSKAKHKDREFYVHSKYLLQFSDGAKLDLESNGVEIPYKAKSLKILAAMSENGCNMKQEKSLSISASRSKYAVVPGFGRKQLFYASPNFQFTNVPAYENAVHFPMSRIYAGLAQKTGFDLFAYFYEVYHD